MSLNSTLNQGVTVIMKTAGRYYLNSKKGRAFLAQALPQIKKSAELRDAAAQNNTLSPVSLIASIASQCNLRCGGCYARHNGLCAERDVGPDDVGGFESAVGSDDVGGFESAVGPDDATPDLSAQEWSSVFSQAEDMGISFVLLAGGEPLLRQEVLKVAASHKNLLFPVFTNGTLLDDTVVPLFDDNRNLIPILSIEGTARETDKRRGAGTSDKVKSAMEHLHAQKILFGVSITITPKNLEIVLEPSFLNDLRQQGCGAAIFVEYVPTEPNTEYLALNESELRQLQAATEQLRQQFSDMIILSFPGDEEVLGGCLASGRGFFHINAAGGAEPCPFSPYSQHNVRDVSLQTVLDSVYFKKLRDVTSQAGAHTGGCTLFVHEHEVQAICM